MLKIGDKIPNINVTTHNGESINLRDFKGKKIISIVKTLIKNKIEFRRGNAGGGNQLRQPYLKKYVKNINPKKFKNVEIPIFMMYYNENGEIS